MRYRRWATARGFRRGRPASRPARSAVLHPALTSCPCPVAPEACIRRAGRLLHRNLRFWDPTLADPRVRPPPDRLQLQRVVSPILRNLDEAQTVHTARPVQRRAEGTRGPDLPPRRRGPVALAAIGDFLPALCTEKRPIRLARTRPSLAWRMFQATGRTRSTDRTVSWLTPNSAARERRLRVAARARITASCSGVSFRGRR